MKKIFNKENIYALIIVLVALHPFIELDYLAYEWLNGIGIPRLTTVVNFIFYPLLVLLAFWFYDRNKKRTIILGVIYGLIFGAYFILHCKNVNQLMDNNTMLLPETYAFTVKEEVFYTLTLMIPLVYVYVFTLSDIKETLLEKMSVIIAYLVSFPILLSNVFVFGKSTYFGMTIDNLFSWFSLPFDDLDHRPRYYASKFFFEEGNPIGILLIFTLPLLYYFFYKCTDKKKKIFLGVTIFIQSFGMIVLSTRIACFGAVIIPFMMAAIYLVLTVLKKERFQKGFIAFIVFMFVITGVFMPVCPAVQNQFIDAQNYEFTKQHDSYLAEQRAKVKRDVGLTKWSEEWRNYYAYMFEEYAFLAYVTPPVYYNELYPYKWDPQFWVDLIFDYTLEERVDGRQIEQIFTDYKYATLNAKEKALGMGYSEYMWGGILIERDFIMQYYTMGSVGFALICAPWILLAIYAGIKLILNKEKWTYLNVILMMIVCIGFASSYFSGHTIDQLSCSMVMAMALGVLLRNLGKKNEQA